MLLVASCAPAPLTPPGEGGTWEVLAPLALGPRQETAVAAVDDEVYIVGGFTRSESVGTVEVFDLENYREAAAVPIALHHANLGVFDGKLYVLGFLTDNSFLADPRSFVYDPATDAWSPLAPMLTSRERGGGGVAEVDGLLYVVGGRRIGAVPEVDRYDPASDAWTAMPDMPASRDHLVVVAHEGIVVASGGRERAIDAHDASTFLFDPTSEVWTTGAPMPTSRAGGAGAVLDGVLYVFGGEGNPEDASGVFPQVEAYNIDDDSWTSLGPMDLPRHGMGAATIGGRIVVPGGGTTRGFDAVDHVDVFVP